MSLFKGPNSKLVSTISITCTIFIFSCLDLINFVCMVIGPVVAEAMFVNREEVPIYPIYRDPVSSLYLGLFIFFYHYMEFHRRG